MSNEQAPELAKPSTFRVRLGGWRHFDVTDDEADMLETLDDAHRDIVAARERVVELEHAYARLEDFVVSELDKEVLR